MTNPSQVGSGVKNNVTLGSIAALAPFAARHTGHGSPLREEPAGAERLRQPQDGAPIRAKLATISAHLQGDFFQEPEDARLTGGTRSLARRLLGLNLRNKQRKTPTIVVRSVPQPKVA